jgi:hypothetical protein
MNIGMLWFDNDPKVGFEVKVERAATYYRNKYGRSPTVCFVHPSMLSGPKNSSSEAPLPAAGHIPRAAGLEIRSNRSVLPNHFWIGQSLAVESEPSGM